MEVIDYLTWLDEVIGDNTGQVDPAAASAPAAAYPDPQLPADDELPAGELPDIIAFRINSRRDNDIVSWLLGIKPLDRSYYIREALKFYIAATGGKVLLHGTLPHGGAGALPVPVPGPAAAAPVEYNQPGQTGTPAAAAPTVGPEPAGPEDKTSSTATAKTSVPAAGDIDDDELEAKLDRW